MLLRAYRADRLGMYPSLSVGWSLGVLGGGWNDRGQLDEGSSRLTHSNVSSVRLGVQAEAC